MTWLDSVRAVVTESFSEFFTMTALSKFLASVTPLACPGRKPGLPSLRFHSTPVASVSLGHLPRGHSRSLCRPQGNLHGRGLLRHVCNVQREPREKGAGHKVAQCH